MLDKVCTSTKLNMGSCPVLLYTICMKINIIIFILKFQVFEVDVPVPNFRQIQSKLQEVDNPVDPRLRRMLGLTEHVLKDNGVCQSISDNDTFDESIIFQCKTPKLSNSIDFESPPNSPPRFYSPFSSTASAGDSKLPSTKGQTSSPRLDPRCQQKNVSTCKLSQAPTTVTAPTNTTNLFVPDIKTYLPSSEWYQNLSSKHKIMVNQQLALVSTELKKFHKDTTPNKIFDMSFILNNQTLQQMLTNLLIFIDDDGQIHRIEQDRNETNMMAANMQRPPPININQPPPFVGFPIDHRNGPPPQITFPLIPSQINMRPGLLGMAPQGFNPFNQPPPPIIQKNNFPQQRSINNNISNINNQRRGNNRNNSRGRRL